MIGLVTTGLANIHARAICEMVALWRSAMTSISSIKCKVLVGHGAFATFSAFAFGQWFIPVGIFPCRNPPASGLYGITAI